MNGRTDSKDYRRLEFTTTTLEVTLPHNDWITAERAQLMSFASVQYFAPPACHFILRFAIGVFLLFAAWSKWSQLANDAVTGNELWDARWFVTVVVLIEIWLGIWLLLEVQPRGTWLVAIGLFIVFALFNLFLAARGDTRCPCFGKNEVSPAAMAVLDMTIALAMSLTLGERPATSNTRVGGSRLIVGLLVVLFLGLPAGLSTVFYSHRGLALDLRSDRHLNANVTTRVVTYPSTSELAALIHDATGLEISVDESLIAQPPDYGVWSIGGPAWSLMIGMADKQALPSRWIRTTTGFRLIASAPWGNHEVLWLTSGVGFTLALATIWAFNIHYGRRRKQTNTSSAAVAV